MLLEDDSRLDLLNGCDRNAVHENENTKPKFIIQPKRVTNMDLKQGRPNFATHREEIQLCPLELRPLMQKSSSSVETKWSNCEVYEKPEPLKKTRIPRRPRQHNDDTTRNGSCNKTGDMYRNILGPTPDESILAGLQTVIDLCGLIDDYKEDTDLSPATDTGSGHAYHRQEIPYPCTIETRLLTTSSRQSNNASTDDANETFLTAPDYSPRKGFMECPYGSNNLGGVNTQICGTCSDVVENMEAVQISAISREKKTKTKKNSKRTDAPCEVCPQCVNETEDLRAYNAKSASKKRPDAPPKEKPITKQPKSGDVCVCDDVCVKPPAPKQPEKTKPPKPAKVKEVKEKKVAPPKQEKPKKSSKSKKEDRSLSCDSCLTCRSKTKTSEVEKPGEYEIGERDSETRGNQKTTRSMRPTTKKSGKSKKEDRSLSCESCVTCGSKTKTSEVEKPGEYEIGERDLETRGNQKTTRSMRPTTSTASSRLIEAKPSPINTTETTAVSKGNRTPEECKAKNLICDKSVCPNKKKKSTCCPQKSKKPPEKSKMKDATCPFATPNTDDCNVCDECIKRVENSGKNSVTPAKSSFQKQERTQIIVKPKETCDASTDFCDKCTECIETLKNKCSGGYVPNSIADVRQPIRIQTISSFHARSGSNYRSSSQTLRKSSSDVNSEEHEQAPSPQSTRIPDETQNTTAELQSRTNVPMYRRTSSGIPADSRISIIEEEDLKPSSYQSVRSRRSSIAQPRSSESVPETSSDVETSETSFRPSKSLEDVKKERSPYKMVGINKDKEMASRSALSTKCFPPVTIPPTYSKTSIAAVPSQDLTSYSCPCRPSKAGGDREPSRNRSVPPVPKSKTSRKDFRRSGMQIPNVQPVIGVCTSQCAGGDKLLDVRYAIVKISVFEHYTTYEIMKSSTIKPKKIPDCVEGIFVTKR